MAKEEQKEDKKERYLKPLYILYPEAEEDTVQQFRAWCKVNAGNRYILGIKILMSISEYQSQIALLTREIAELKLKVYGDETPEETDERIPTMGGMAQ